jgi:hypothetical protein
MPCSVDLPPTEVARPLPTSKSAAANGIFTSELANKRSNKKRKRKTDADDDTPKAFQRLMAFQKGQKLPSGLDDGVRHPKKAKKGAANTATNNGGADGQTTKKTTPSNTHSSSATEIPTIKPGERMADFAARVDAALPVAGLITKGAKGGKDPLGLKVVRTKTEKRMHRMYAEWREEEKKIQERKMDALEKAEEDEMAEDEQGNVRWKTDLEQQDGETGGGKKAKKGKGKKKKVLGEVDDGEEDPWAKLKRDRAETKAGLHDVVQAPPTFLKAPREKFKVRGAQVDVGDVPKASGSLRRREELGDVRRSVVERYREMMKENRTKAE